MLFFQECLCRKLSKTKNNRTSPVRNSFYCMKTMHIFREKRALSPASRPLSNSADGSLALEAALALTLFLFACVCLAAPIKLFDQQRKIQGALEQAGEDLSRYAYVKYCLDKGDGEVECGDDIASILTIGYVRQKVMSVVDQRMIRQVSLGESRILEEDMICLRVSYRFYLPVAFPGMSSIPMEAVCVRRAWTGAEGGRHSPSGSSGEAEDPIVYVGKGSTRYHLSARCHYLHNNLQAVCATRREEGIPPASVVPVECQVEPYMLCPAAAVTTHPRTVRRLWPISGLCASQRWRISASVLIAEGSKEK